MKGYLIKFYMEQKRQYQGKALLQQQSFSLFYIKVPIEYGSLGQGA